MSSRKSKRYTYCHNCAAEGRFHYRTSPKDSRLQCWACSTCGARAVDKDAGDLAAGGVFYQEKDDEIKRI